MPKAGLKHLYVSGILYEEEIGKFLSLKSAIEKKMCRHLMNTDLFSAMVTMYATICENAPDKINALLPYIDQSRLRKRMSKNQPVQYKMDLQPMSPIRTDMPTCESDIPKTKRGHCLSPSHGMSSIEEYIKSIESKLPDMCSDDDLVASGVRDNKKNAANLRSSGQGPKWFKKCPRTLRYMKQDVIDWLRTINGQNTPL